MSDLIRDATLGQIIRWMTGNRVLQYEEEKPGFQLPDSYKPGAQPTKSDYPSPSQPQTPFSRNADDLEKSSQEGPNTASRHPSGSRDHEKLERIDTAKDDEHHDVEKADTQEPGHPSAGNTTTLEPVRTQEDIDEAFRSASLVKTRSHPIAPQRTNEGYILVDFYDTDDPENPHNWSLKKKSLSTFVVCMYTFAVYLGSAIYTPSINGVMDEFNVGITVATLGLALYVLAYGIGPLFFSPISEIPVVGRNPPYMASMLIFVALCVAAPLIHNIAGLLVVRFLQGFFGSPCLATGGASLSDMYAIIKLPYVISLWALAATCGPALGPMISGFSVAAEGWRWSLWEMLWLAGPVFIAMVVLLPETSTPNILLRRAKRLRKLTGNNNFKSQSELDQANLKPRDIIFDALVRPGQLIIMDPAIGFTAAYVSLCYAIYYSFFEAFPIVFIEHHGFNLGQMGVTFICITIACVLFIGIYWIYVYKVVEPDFRANGIGQLERRLIPALYSSFLLPIGLFIFAWTSAGDIHWIAPVIGVFLFTGGVMILIQCIFVYLPMVYPQYAASLFAGNDFARSSLAFAAILFSRPMFLGIGVGSGVSLLAALTAACIGGIFILYFYGDKLRARSRFSMKY